MSPTTIVSTLQFFISIASANYYAAYIAVPRENFTEWSNSWDESHYVKSLAPFLTAQGVPAHFIIDQGRAGKLAIRTEWGQWCNIKNAGFGARPTTATNDPLVDALVWAKPGMSNL